MRYYCFLFIFLAACQDQATDSKAVAVQQAEEPAEDTAPTWHQDVAPIFSKSCNSCHQPGGFGTPTWTTVEEIRQWAPVIALSVENRQMPPWYAAPGCREYENDFSLSEEEIDTVVAWAEHDAPLGDVSKPSPLLEPFDVPKLEREDLVIEMPEAYTPIAQPDDYRCFIIEWPHGDSWVTGYEIQPGNTDIVHHVIPYIIDPGDADSFRVLDAQDEAQGYTCYGGPGGDVATLLNTRWLGAWAPGTGAGLMPEGTGIRIKEGSLIVFQVHYNSTSETPASDQSAMALQIEDTQQGWSNVQPLTDVAWVLGSGMDIPAESDSVSHSWSSVLESSFQMHSASIHMHTLGKSGSMWVERADGTEECLVVYNRYDFDWQRAYAFTEPVRFEPGDTIHLECSWDNPTEKDIAWGDGTGDEMCLGVSLLSQ